MSTEVRGESSSSSSLDAGHYAVVTLRRLVVPVRATAHDFEHTRSEDDLHDVRVATRRLRAGLSFFAPVLDPRLEHTRKTLRRRAVPLGDLRDTDVFLERLQDSASPISAADTKHLGREATRVRRRQLKAARATLDSDKFTKALRRVRHSRKHVVTTTLAGQPARTFVAARLDRWWRDLLADSTELARLEPHPRHLVRIQAKKLRYACEMTADLFSQDADAVERLLDELKHLQDELGDLNDDVSAGRRLQDAGVIDRLPRTQLRPLARAVRVRESLAHTEPYWR